VAGMIARTDATRGVHRAPGGSAAVLSGTTGTTVSTTPAEQDEFNRLGVNVIRTIPSLGTVVWGARTQSLDSEWRYVPVRRTFLYISESLDRGLRWVVLEPNDEPLWQRVRITIGGFLLGLFRDGAFAGSTPDEGFFVRCDRTTMTQSDIDRGLLVCVIGIAPLRPVEFVVFSLVLRTADAEA
jgi:phage tail sheath protein FI